LRGLEDRRLRQKEDASKRYDDEEIRYVVPWFGDWKEARDSLVTDDIS